MLAEPDVEVESPAPTAAVREKRALQDEPQRESLTCPFCGERERVELFEVWGHDFLMDTCCEAMNEEVNAFLAEEPYEAGKWMSRRFGELLPGSLGSRKGVRSVADNGTGGLILDFNLKFREVTLSTAKEFVEKHHRHCPDAPRGWRFGIGVTNQATLVGVAMCGRPVARMLKKDEVVEVNRLCIDPNLPQPLVANAASMLYGWSARKARQRGFRKAITYLRADELGTSLKAAGWVPEAKVRGRSWDTPSRPREQKSEVIDKVRWAISLERSRPTAKASNTGSRQLSLV